MRNQIELNFKRCIYMARKQLVQISIFHSRANISLWFGLLLLHLLLLISPPKFNLEALELMTRWVWIKSLEIWQEMALRYWFLQIFRALFGDTIQRFLTIFSHFRLLARKWKKTDRADKLRRTVSFRCTYKAADQRNNNTTFWVVYQLFITILD